MDESAPVPRWEHFPHGADIGVRGLGRTRAEAFEQAALAMTAAIADPAAVRGTRAIPIACRAGDDATLLVDWLNELVYAMAVEGLLFGAFRVAIAGEALGATAWGEPVDVARHQPAVEVKGATLTAARVERRPDGTWLAQCVIDV